MARVETAGLLTRRGGRHISADEKTGGKHADTIDQATGKARDALDALAGKNDDIPPGTTAR